jgi:YD repeat-containing protein
VGIDRVSNNYDFTGKITSTHTTHSVSNLTWKNTDMWQADGKYVKRTSSGGYGGASSVESFTGDGWAEATLSETTTWRYWGLSESDPDKTPQTIKYCFYLFGAQLQVLENGVLKTSVSNLASGDRLRIARTSGAIKYYRNGTLVYTSAVSSSAALYVDVSISSSNGTILNLNLSNDRTTQTTLRTFDYDHAGRLISTHHSVNGGALVLLAKNEYNELGQLVDKKLYSTNNADYRQSIDYRYNIRGWLTSMNGASVNETESNDGDTDSRQDLFGINLHYNNTITGLGNTAMFNGNISAMRWKVNLGLGAMSKRAYTFSYDPMNRLLGSEQNVYDTQWRSEAGFTESGLEYDLNGNITKLQRLGANGALMDKLSYQYGAGNTAGNQLLKVSDAGDKKTGFTEDLDVYNDYTYDRNGNMITDNNKGIGSITYNVLNLPSSVSKTGQGTIQYYYDATGRKLSQVVLDASNVSKKSTDYHGEFIYENDSLKFCQP